MCRIAATALATPFAICIALDIIAYGTSYATLLTMPPPATELYSYCAYPPPLHVSVTRASVASET